MPGLLDCRCVLDDPASRLLLSGCQPASDTSFESARRDGSACEPWTGHLAAAAAPVHLASHRPARRVTRFAAISCGLASAERSQRQQRRQQHFTAAAQFACISTAAATAAARPALEGPGQALRLHAEELRAAAEALAERQAHEAAQKRHKQRAVRRQQRRERIIFEGINHVKHMAAGALAACVSRTVVAPFERVKMECILHRRSNAAVAVAVEVFRSEGVLGFWRGNGLNLLRTAPYKAVNFSSYDAYRKLLQSQASTAELGRVGSFVAGAMAGITAMVMCFPLDVVRTRILAAGTAGTASPFGVMRSIVQREGFAALYAGCLPALISVAPSGAVFYGTYDVLKERHLAIARSRGHPQKSLGTSFTLLYGGLAGVAAESAVYPLQVIQRYMQMHSATEAGKGVVTALSAQQALSLAKMPGLAHPIARAAFRFSSSARVIYASHGVAGFYTGILPNVCQVLPNAALSYFAYEAFKQLLAAED